MCCGRDSLTISARVMRRISSAVLTHTYGRGSSFQCSIHSLMSVASWRTERCVPRRIFFMVSSPNQRSTRFSHDELVGTKCRWKRG